MSALKPAAPVNPRPRSPAVSRTWRRFMPIRTEPMHFGLNDEQEMIVSTVRSFVENEIYPHEAEVERSGQVPDDLAQAIKRKTLDLGFYACNFPEEVGGDGLGHLDFALVERELLPAVRGERMDALAMTEPDAGSDVRGMKCTARRDGGDWVLNGTKHFISGADHADFVIVFVATGEDMTD